MTPCVLRCGLYLNTQGVTRLEKVDLNKFDFPRPCDPLCLEIRAVSQHTGESQGLRTWISANSTFPGLVTPCVSRYGLYLDTQLVTRPEKVDLSKFDLPRPCDPLRVEIRAVS